MVAGYPACNSHPPARENIAPEVLPMLVLFPCQVFFAAYFLIKLYRHNLNETSDNPMANATISYVLISLLATGFAFGNEVIEPIRQTSFSPAMDSCRFTRFFSWFFAGAAYAVLIEVFLTRVSSVFESSQYKVSPLIRMAFRSSILVTALFAGTLFTIRSVKMDCWTKRSFGFLSDTPLFPKRVFFCNVPARFLWLRLVSTAAVLIVFSCEMCILLWMFVWRMKKMDQSLKNGGIHENHTFQKLIEKSSVISLTGLISSLTSLILTAITGYTPVVYLDFLFSNVLLFCLFKFGSDTYHFLFGWFLRWKNGRSNDSVMSATRSRFGSLQFIRISRTVSANTSADMDDVDYSP